MLWALEDSGRLCVVRARLRARLGVWIGVGLAVAVAAAEVCIMVCRVAAVVEGAAIVEGAPAASPSAMLCRVIVVVSGGRLDGDVAEDHAPQLILEGACAGIFGLHGRDCVCAVRAESRWLLGDGG